MINDEEILKKRQERMNLHKRNLEDITYRSYYNQEKEEKSSFMFNTIICFFIFASIVVIKLTNTPFTDNLTNKLNFQLSKDNLPLIKEFVTNAKSENFALDQIYSIKAENHTESEDTQTVEVNENKNLPDTEFTIDENMLSDINSDEGLDKKK